MKYTILGFNQELAVKHELSVNDLLLLQYIMYANGSPNMEHTMDYNVSYVWLSHAKISEDLPILNYTEGTLRNKLSELKKKGLIQSISIPFTKGSKTYYSITELTVSFINDTGHHSEMTSYNNTNNINTLSKDNVYDAETLLDDFSESIPKKSKKKNLYQQCLDLIHEYTNDAKLVDLLVQYLNFVLEKYRHEGRVLYKNQWSGMLNKLDEICGAGNCRYGDVVQQSITKGYVGFYPVNTYSKPKTYVPDTNKAPQHKAGQKARNEDGTLKEY